MTLLLKLLPILAIMFGCKTSNPSELEEADRPYQGEICCAEQRETGVFYHTRTCNKTSPTACCNQRRFPAFFNRPKQFAGYFFGNCDRPSPEYLTDVEICRGKTRFGAEQPGFGNVVDSGAGLSQLGHAWIKIRDLEVGMGPTKPPPHKDKKSLLHFLNAIFTAQPLKEKLQVSWTDHAGFSQLEGTVCEKLYLCDEACVNNELQIDKSLGSYSILNQCHIKAVEVLRACGCLNHCIGNDPISGTCVNRVFPELRGFRLGEPGYEE